jgi:hypothetical protein
VKARCTCGVADWQAFRVALDLTQPQMADLLCMSVRHVQRLEATGQHTCPAEASVKWLRLKLLVFPEYRARLTSVGHPYPFPSDLQAGPHLLLVS